MADRASRHSELAVYQRDLPGAGSPVQLYEPRLRTRPAASRYHSALASDRLDTIAQRYLGDPYQYWRIADANPDLDLEHLTEPGTILSIPDRG